MNQFVTYKNLQNLLLLMNDEEQKEKVKQFIIDNNLFKNQKRSFSTMKLIASVVYLRPELFNIATKLLSSFSTINLSSKIQTSTVCNSEIAYRMKVLYLLLVSSKHSKNNISNTDPDDRFFIFPHQNKKQIDAELKRFYSKQEGGEDPTNIKGAEISELRNSFHSFHPAVQAIRKDDLQLLLDIISKLKLDISSELPSSFYEIHEILQNATLLEYAAFFGSSQCFAYLQSKQESVNYEKLLEFAIAGGKGEIIDLIEKSVNIEKIEEKANLLHLAILYMRNDLIEHIISKYQVKIESECYIKCIYSSNYDAFLKLKAKDTSDEINKFGENGSPPIDIAAFEGSFIFFKYLSQISNPKCYNSFGKTILHSAVRNQNMDIIKYIVKHKLVDLDDAGDYGITPIEVARNYNYQVAYQYLLQFCKEPPKRNDVE